MIFVFIYCEEIVTIYYVSFFLRGFARPNVSLFLTGEISGGNWDRLFGLTLTILHTGDTASQRVRIVIPIQKSEK